MKNNEPATGASPDKTRNRKALIGVAIIVAILLVSQLASFIKRNHTGMVRYGRDALREQCVARQRTWIEDRQVCE